MHVCGRDDQRSILSKKKFPRLFLNNVYVIPFPDSNKKVYIVLQSLYLCKSNKYTWRSRKKSMSIFGHVTCGIHWKMFATFFLCFIAGEWHGSVNIYYLVRAIKMLDSVSFAVHNQDLKKNSIKCTCVTFYSWCRRCFKIKVIQVFLQLSTKIFYFLVPM